MKNTRTRILASVVVLSVALIITEIAWAGATKTYVAGTLSVVPIAPPAKLWIDDEGILHTRG